MSAPGEADDDGRAVMHVLYAMHTIAWASAGSLAVIAVIVNYIVRDEARYPFFARHHSYMISTFWWTVLWLALSSPLWLAFVVPGAIAWGVVGLWYLYRCLRGWIRFSQNRDPMIDPVLP